MHGGFIGWGGPANVRGDPIFDGRYDFLLLGKALQSGVIFQKYALKLAKIWKIIEKMKGKCKIFDIF